MQRLAVALVLSVLAFVSACGNKTKTGPTTPPAPALPKVTEGPITKDSLFVFMKERFPAQIQDGTLELSYGTGGTENEVIEELSILGITTTGQLNVAVPVDFATKGFDAIKASSDPTTNVAGVLRDLMIIHNPKLYVEKAWRNGWMASGPEDFPAPVAYGVDMSILETGGVFSGGGGEPCGGDYCDGVEDPCDGEGDPCGD